MNNLEYYHNSKNRVHYEFSRLGFNLSLIFIIIRIGINITIAILLIALDQIYQSRHTGNLF